MWKSVTDKRRTICYEVQCTIHIGMMAPTKSEYLDLGQKYINNCILLTFPDDVSKCDPEVAACNFRPSIACLVHRPYMNVLQNIKTCLVAQRPSERDVLGDFRSDWCPGSVRVYASHAP